MDQIETQWLIFYLEWVSDADFMKYCVSVISELTGIGFEIGPGKSLWNKKT